MASAEEGNSLASCGSACLDMLIEALEIVWATQGMQYGTLSGPSAVIVVSLAASTALSGPSAVLVVSLAVSADLEYEKGERMPLEKCSGTAGMPCR